MKRALLGLLALACSKVTPAEEIVPDPTPPANLVAVISAPSFSGALDQLRTVVEAVQPGRSAMLSEGMVSMVLAGQLGVSSLEGLDFAAPIHLLVIDPKKHSSPLLLLARVKDEDAVKKGAGTKARFSKGWVLVGDPTTAGGATRYAFSLADAKPPSDITATVPVGNLLALYRDDLERGRKELATFSGGDATSKVIDLYFDFLIVAMEQTDRVVATARADGEALRIDFGFVPRPATTFLQFVTQQKPSDFALVGKLPAGPANIVAAGHVELGAAGRALYGAVESLFAGAGMDPRWASTFRDLMTVCDGEFAVLGDMTGARLGRLVQVFSVTDPTAAGRAVEKMVDLLASGKGYDVMGVGAEYALDPVARKYGGATYRAYDTKVEMKGIPDMPPPTRSYVGVVDRFVLLTVGPLDKDEMPQVIDAVRGKGSYQPLPPVQAALDEARRSKDSAVFFVDFGAMMAGSPPGAGISMGIGFTDGALHWRITAPIAAIASFKKTP